MSVSGRMTTDGNKAIHPIAEPSTVKHQNSTTEITMSLGRMYPASPIIYFRAFAISRLMVRHTLIAGIAHAQSRARLPCEGAFETSSGEAPVAPIQSMYESTRRVTWSAIAGRDGSEDGRYIVSIEIVVDIVVEEAFVALQATFQLEVIYYVINDPSP